MSLYATNTALAQNSFEEYKKNELRTLISSYQSISADYLRGLSLEEWIRRVAILEAKAKNTKNYRDSSLEKLIQRI